MYLLYSIYLRTCTWWRVYCFIDEMKSIFRKTYGSLLYLSCPPYIPLTFQKILSSKLDRKIPTVACYVFHVYEIYLLVVFG